MPLPFVVGSILTFLKVAPTLVRAGTEIYDRIRNTEKSRQIKNDVVTEDMRVLRTEVEYLQQRLETQEANAEAQADLIVQLTRHNADLVRWLLFMAIGLALSSGVAVAALLLALLV